MIALRKSVREEHEDFRSTISKGLGFKIDQTQIEGMTAEMKKKVDADYI
jgi:hypothetical protein